MSGPVWSVYDLGFHDKGREDLMMLTRRDGGFRRGKAWAAFWGLLAACGAFLGHPQQVSAQFWEVNGVPTDASGDGSVIVGDNTTTGQYFMWTAATGAMDIGGAIAGGGVGGTARISNDGSRVGGTNLNSASGFFEMSYYETASGTWTPVGGIGAACSNELSSGWNISGDGNHMVGLGWLSCADAHAMQWTEGIGTSDLGSSVLNQSSRANAVSTDGKVVAGWQDGNGREAAVWDNGVQTVLSGTGEAGGVSDDGQFVVGIGGSATVAGGVAQAWRWSAATGLEPLGTITTPSPFPPSPRGFASGINADGSLVVGFDRTGFGPPVPISRGWVWQEGSGMMPLGDYFESFGISVPGFNYNLPLGVSADGRTFFGLGTQAPSIAARGWIVTVPEPGALGLFLLGGLAIWRSGRR